MNRDQIDGRIKQSGGQLKQFAGKALGNTRLEHEGRVQQATGRAQACYGDIKNGIKNDVRAVD